MSERERQALAERTLTPDRDTEMCRLASDGVSTIIKPLDDRPRVVYGEDAPPEYYGRLGEIMREMGWQRR